MISVSKQVCRTTCILCEFRTNSILCDGCKSETREDFYLFLLTKIKDEGNNYFDLHAKCIDIHDAVDYYQVPNNPVLMFDENVHSVDKHAKELLDEHTIIKTDDLVPVIVAGDGDCLFHAIQTYYPTMTIDELRVRCVDELCSHEYYYSTIKTEMGLDLVDDESVQDHVLRMLNNGQYMGVLTLSALSTVIGKPIESIYPSVNDNDAYGEILNTVFIPRSAQSSSMETPIRIMWSGSEKQTYRIWLANHFVPVLSLDQSVSAIETESTIEIIKDNVRDVEVNDMQSKIVPHSSKLSNMAPNQIETVKENYAEMKNSTSVLDKRHIFLEASAIIQQMIDAAKNGKIFEQPPKMITHASMYIVKLSDENHASIRKDGNGVWINVSSVKTLFVLKDSDKYQIVRHDAVGNLFYNERVGNRYVSYPVNSNQVITMHRYYATNGSNPSLRRMIAYSSQTLADDNSVKLDLPMFLQYAICSRDGIENLQLRPHGNAKKSNRPFTSTVPSVLAKIKLQPPFIKPSAIYSASINSVEQTPLAPVTIVRDRVQVYNARRKNESNVEEYLAIMRSLEMSNSTVARFSMSRGEAPVLMLSQPHMIQELKRCCINPPDSIPPSIICVNTTFDLGRFFVTPIKFRNTAVQYRKTKKVPIFIGPTMIHYRTDAQAYQELLDYVRRELNCGTVVIGSDGEKAIKKAVDSVFPDSTHLYCTRHVRNNIERQLVKCRSTQDERRALLDLIFDSSESLIQSETEEEFQEKLNSLDELWTTIRGRDAARYGGATDFFQWFNQYQTNNFRNHLIATVRIPINFVDRNGSPRLFYNNDAESMNHVLKNETNWELRSLSEIVGIIGKIITTERNESIRALYDSGELEMLSPYSRFICIPHIWAAKTTEERREIIDKYYNYIPPASKSRRDFNISLKAGRKPGRSNVRGSSTTTRKKK